MLAACPLACGTDRGFPSDELSALLWKLNLMDTFRRATPDDAAACAQIRFDAFGVIKVACSGLSHNRDGIQERPRGRRLCGERREVQASCVCSCRNNILKPIQIGAGHQKIEIRPRWKATRTCGRKLSISPESHRMAEGILQQQACLLGPHVVPADKAQPMADLVANALRHRGRPARVFPCRRINHLRRGEMVERHVFRIAAAGLETTRA